MRASKTREAPADLPGLLSFWKSRQPYGALSTAMQSGLFGPGSQAVPAV